MDRNSLQSQLKLCMVGLKLLIAVLSPAIAGAETYYVANNGVDANIGSIERPFASVMHAQEVASPGDTVFIRGGTFLIAESQIAKQQRIWAHVILLDKSGTEGKRINYWAYENEQPVFDFSAVKPRGKRVHAFSVSVDNLFLNCDAFNNYDSFSENGRGGNTDGFGCHPIKGGTGNVFRGCRAWFNSDDGFDCISASETVTFENCWAFNDGYSTNFKSLADGNGFKAGGYGSIRNDLMGVRFDVKLLFPADDSGHGFDNVGDALSFSPLLMEKYLKAARMVVDDAVPTETKVVPLHVFRNGDFSDQNGKTGTKDLQSLHRHDFSSIWRPRLRQRTLCTGRSTRSLWRRDSRILSGRHYRTANCWNWLKLVN